MRVLRYTIPEGELTCTLEQEYGKIPVSDLFAVVSRNNPNRQFLFASTVLCRHLPSRPQFLRQACRDLSERLPRSGNPTLFVGFAETATALGYVLMEEFGCDRAFYLCTTRHFFDRPVLAKTVEAHSHAPNHILYRPDFPLDGTWDVIFIDDEYTTASTAETLCAELRKKLRVDRVTYASLLDWSGRPDHVSLCSGTCVFDRTASHAFPEKASEGNRLNPPRGSWGRFGVHGTRTLRDFHFHPSERVLCIGRGEYAIDACLAAEQAERAGAFAHCCATTRSPIRQGETVKNVLRLNNEFGLPYYEYLYNVDPDRYDRVLVFSETDRSDPVLSSYFGGNLETCTEASCLSRP